MSDDGERELRMNTRAARNPLTLTSVPYRMLYRFPRKLPP
jgi:hypothetical protein